MTVDDSHNNFFTWSSEFSIWNRFGAVVRVWQADFYLQCTMAKIHCVVKMYFHIICRFWNGLILKWHVLWITSSFHSKCAVRIMIYANFHILSCGVRMSKTPHVSCCYTHNVHLLTCVNWHHISAEQWRLKPFLLQNPVAYVRLYQCCGSGSGSCRIRSFWVTWFLLTVHVLNSFNSNIERC